MLERVRQTELHRHLDVSTRIRTVHELATQLGVIPQSTSLQTLRDQILILQPMTDLNAVLAQFTIYQKILRSPEIIERVGFEVVEDCYQEGTRQVELRFSPSFVAQYSGLAWDDILSAFERGLRRAQSQYPDMRAGLICIGSRDYGIGEIERVVDFYLKNIEHFVGMDLAGNEVDFPNRLFESAFRKIKSHPRARITVHAGEAAGAANIWAAIELLGARRIGHGIRCVDDPHLMNTLRDRRICLEMCPTSNWLTQVVPSLEAHPLPQVLRHGIPVSINTDDPGIFDLRLPGEVKLCQTRMGLSPSEIALTFEHADQSRFLA